MIFELINRALKIVGANNKEGDEDIKARLGRFYSRLRRSVFVWNLSLTFLTRAAMMLFSLLLAVVITRYFGAVGKGITAVVMTILQVALQFGNFGLHSSNVYYVSKYREKLPSIVANTIWLSLIGGVIIAVITIVIIILFPQIIEGIPFLYSLVPLVFLPFFLLYLLCQYTLLGLQKVKLYNLIEIINGSTILIFTALAAILFGAGVFSAIVIPVVDAFLLSMFLAFYLLRLSGWNLRFDFILFREMFTYGLRAYLASLFAFLVLRFDVLMVNYFLDTAQTGIYSMAVNMGNLIYMAPIIFGTILFPKISAMKDEKERWSFAKKGILFITILMSFGSVVFAMIARPLVVFLFGRQFLPAVPALWILLPGIVFLSSCTIINNYFASLGMPIVALYSPLAAFLINILLNYLLIPKLGINGAAVASSISYMCMLIMSTIYLKSVKDIRIADSVSSGAKDTLDVFIE